MNAKTARRERAKVTELALSLSGAGVQDRDVVASRISGAQSEADRRREKIAVCKIGGPLRQEAIRPIRGLEFGDSKRNSGFRSALRFREFSLSTTR
jgi:hypothetical protein